MAVTAAQIAAAEAENDRISETLTQIARVIGAIQSGNSHYYSKCYYERHELEDFNPNRHNDRRQWDEGTPVVVVWFSDPACDYFSVVFPQSWLNQDYEALATTHYANRRVAKKKEEQAEVASRAIAKEKAERETYERLRAKFEGEPQP